VDAPVVLDVLTAKQGYEESLVVSIVSHGHAAVVQLLLDELAQLSRSTVARVVVTQNVPEAHPIAPPGGWPFRFDLLCNSEPQGFGANHNRALEGAQETLVCVLNPDVSLGGMDPFAELKRVALQDRGGCAYPEQVDSRGEAQDFERAYPTLGALWARRVLRQPERRTDWVNAACLVLPRTVWNALGGFDVRYFMYCEDVDFSVRLRLAGVPLRRAPVRVIHAGRRASRRELRHLIWHVRSLLRLWRSPAYRAALHTVTVQSGSKVTIDPS
jgi:N-acetylglucosaminyl-diphospho-decaprenol L-rhamnosyltransferase